MFIVAVMNLAAGRRACGDCALYSFLTFWPHFRKYILLRAPGHSIFNQRTFTTGITSLVSRCIAAGIVSFGQSWMATRSLG